MSFKFLQHTADVRLKVTGKTLEDVFIDSMKGLMELMKPGFESSATTKVQREISLKSEDITMLLIDFLSELLCLAQTNFEIYFKIDILELSENKLTATVIGEMVDGFDEDVKAVTFHEADVQKNENGDFETVVIFDI